MAAQHARTQHRPTPKVPHRKVTAAALRRRTAPAEPTGSRDLVRATRAIQPW